MVIDASRLGVGSERLSVYRFKTLSKVYSFNIQSLTSFNKREKNFLSKFNIIVIIIIIFFIDR